MKKDLIEKRVVTDRRKFCYTSYSPERRTGKDRRRSLIQPLKKKVA